MAKGEINLLCAEIDKLLNDICKFLNEEIRGGYLSETGRTVATMLIERSKQQLQTIAITVDSDNSDSMLESYVDMQPYKTNIDEQYPEPHEVYSDVSLTYEPSLRSSTTGDQIICPFINFPAAEIKNGKSGFLYKKEKILFFEQQKKIYAAIHQAWFLIYLNEHSLKPLLTFDLSRYEVRASQKDSKKREESFELVNPTDPKMHHFTAQTSKDMYQWIAALRVQIDSLVTVRNLPTIPQKQKEDNFVRLSNESNNDYEPLKTYIIKETTKPTVHKEQADPPLPLPPRNATLKKSPVLKTYIPKTSSSESLSSNYDSVGIGIELPSRETSNSFSEDDSDTHYDDPSELRSQNVLPYVKQYEANKDDDDDNDIYDYLENPSFARQQQVVTPSPPPKKIQEPPKNEIKPKPVIKPKLALSLRNKKKSGL